MCDNEIGLCVYNMDIILGSVVNVTGVVLQDPFSNRNNFHFDLLQLLHFNSDSITEKEVPHATHNYWRDDIEFPVRSNGNFSVELEMLTTRPHTLHGKSFTLFGAKVGPLRVRNPPTHTHNLLTCKCLDVDRLQCCWALKDFSHMDMMWGAFSKGFNSKGGVQEPMPCWHPEGHSHPALSATRSFSHYIYLQEDVTNWNLV